ncbi:hypothetical protein SRHO_G00311270 [Serrasalmus rhombeus]
MSSRQDAHSTRTTPCDWLKFISRLRPTVALSADSRRSRCFAVITGVKSILGQVLLWTPPPSLRLHHRFWLIQTVCSTTPQVGHLWRTWGCKKALLFSDVPLTACICCSEPGRLQCEQRGKRGDTAVSGLLDLQCLPGVCR